MNHKSYLKYIYPFLSLLIIIASTYLAIQIGKGYRPTRQGLIGTGLLAANSFPSGAEVYIDNKLVTATDTTINLPPGDYRVDIRRDGYLPWSKNLTIQAELVTQTNAQLFRSIPTLSPLTLSGVSNVYPSPDGQKIAYTVTDASTPARNGLYVLDLNSTSQLFANREPRQIARNPRNFDLSKAHFLWSPSSTQVLVHYDPGDSLATNNFLLDINRLNDIDTAPDVTARLSLILSDWEEEIVNRETKQFSLLPPEIQHIATSSATNVYFSPNEEKVMYTATEYTSLPDQITTPLPASNTQPQSRDLEPNNIYVYDLKEDRNFRIDITYEPITPQKTFLLLNDYQQSTSSADINSITPTIQLPIQFDHLQSDNNIPETIQRFNTHYSAYHTTPLQWFPTSNHLLIIQADSIDIVEYDNTNRHPLYSGPFGSDFVYPWPNGTRLVITTNLNSPHLPTNLYAVEIK